MPRFLLFIVLVASTIFARAQSANDIILRVLANNTTLRASAYAATAEQLSNRCGNQLDGPEIEFGYLWGSPASTGSRKDFSVSQSFDYATVFGLKAKLARSRNELVDLRQAEQRLTLATEVAQLLISITYYNQVEAEYKKRITTARQLLALTEKAIHEGNATLLDCNKAKLALTTVITIWEEKNIERNNLLARLRLLLGGESIHYPATEYEPISFGETLSSLTQQQLCTQKKVLAQEVRTARAANLPQLAVGYMQEVESEKSIRGLTLGLNIPLWSNAHNVRRAKAQERAAESEAYDALLQLAQQRTALSEQLRMRRTAIDNLQQALADASTLEILDKTLKEGHLSLIDYLTEACSLYELNDRLMLAERDYQLTRTQLLFLGE